MLLLVGLGNPGREHAGNRHNIGFKAVDAIIRRHGFSAPKARAALKAAIAEGTVGGEKVIALMPLTYMNLSGEAVGAAMRYWKLSPEDVTVIYDEIDLFPGKVRVKRGGGTAGHNGLRSLDAHIGPDFTRVRIGIGHPGDKRLVSGHVLGDFAKADAPWVEDLLAGIVDGAPALATGDTPGFLAAVARRMPPPGDTPSPAEPADPRSPLRKLADRFR
jgi:PTH1 family peptidyl-tRNA hydrolase